MDKTYLIFVLFSPHTQFLVKIFSTQKRVNRNKTDFTTKQRKLRQTRFCNKKMSVCSCGEVCHVETFLHMTDFSTLLQIYHVESFLYVIDFLHISHVEKLFHMTICHIWKNSPHDRFFSTVYSADTTDTHGFNSTGCIVQYI